MRHRHHVLSLSLCLYISTLPRKFLLLLQKNFSFLTRSRNKGVPPLTLSRDWVGDVCMLCPRADPSSVPPRLFFPIVTWETKAKESRGRPQSPLALPEKTNIIGKGSRIPCAQSFARGIFSSPKRQKTPLTLTNQGLIGIRQRLILPGRVQPSTFSTGELNCCVRDGNRWNLSVIATGNCGYLVASPYSFLPFRKRRVEDPLVGSRGKAPWVSPCHNNVQIHAARAERGR